MRTKKAGITRTTYTIASTARFRKGVLCLAAASTVSIMGIRSAHKRVMQRVHKLRKMQMERQKLLGLALLVQFVCACVRARPAWRADSNSLLLVFRSSFFYFFSLSNNAFPMQQKPPANSQSPPIKGR